MKPHTTKVPPKPAPKRIRKRFSDGLPGTDAKPVAKLPRVRTTPFRAPMRRVTIQNARRQRVLLTVATLNVTGGARTFEVQKHLATLCKQHKVDVISLTETWVRETDDTVIKVVDGYRFFLPPGNGTERGMDGVGFAVRAEIDARLVETPTDPVLEGRLAVLTVHPRGTAPIRIAAVYAPLQTTNTRRVTNAKDSDSDDDGADAEPKYRETPATNFWKAADPTLRACNIRTGDFNCDFTKPGSYAARSFVSSAMDDCVDALAVKGIKTPTFVPPEGSAASASRIDYVFVKRGTHICGAVSVAPHDLAIRTAHAAIIARLGLVPTWVKQHKTTPTTQPSFRQRAEERFFAPANDDGGSLLTHRGRVDELSTVFTTTYNDFVSKAKVTGDITIAPPLPTHGNTELSEATKKAVKECGEAFKTMKRLHHEHMQRLAEDGSDTRVPTLDEAALTAATAAYNKCRRGATRCIRADRRKAWI
ncbi:MAG: endonuclease/exonuclease/phosphatase family protein, partial [Planctomycetota bacterium]